MVQHTIGLAEDCISTSTLDESAATLSQRYLALHHTTPKTHTPHTPTQWPTHSKRSGLVHNMKEHIVPGADDLDTTFIQTLHSHHEHLTSLRPVLDGANLPANSAVRRRSCGRSLFSQLQQIAKYLRLPNFPCEHRSCVPPDSIDRTHVSVARSPTCVSARCFQRVLDKWS